MMGSKIFGVHYHLVRPWLNHVLLLQSDVIRFVQNGRQIVLTIFGIHVYKKLEVSFHLRCHVKGQRQGN